MRILFSFILAAGLAPAAVVSVYNSSAAWSGAVSGIVTETFENAPFNSIQRIGPGSAASVNIVNGSYRVDRLTDSISRVVEMQPGAYAPTGVLSSQNAANLEPSNLVLTPTAPVFALGFEHAAWRGTQIQIVLTFVDATQQTFLANTVGPTVAVASGLVPMPFTGFVSDVAIGSVRVETTVSANDGFARGLNIDNFSTASAVPEPGTLGLLGAGLVVAGLWRLRGRAAG